MIRQAFKIQQSLYIVSVRTGVSFLSKQNELLKLAPISHFRPILIADHHITAEVLISLDL
jgi:hypothetical protein